jgi:predicted peroxiredoxin
MVCKSSLFFSWLLHRNIKEKMRIYGTSIVLLWLNIDQGEFIDNCQNINLPAMITTYVYDIAIWMDQSDKILNPEIVHVWGWLNWCQGDLHCNMWVMWTGVTFWVCLSVLIVKKIDEEVINAVFKIIGGILIVYTLLKAGDIKT